MKLTETVFVMMDTETTDPNHPKVIELAGLRWSYADGFLEGKETFVHPGEKIHPASMAIHHIRNEDVAGAPRMEEIDREWDEWVGDSIILAYNSDYDQGVLSSVALGQKTWMDVYRMAMHFWSFGQLNDDGFPLTSFKQQELRYWLGVPPTTGDAHRAMADIQVTAHIVHRVIDKYLECGLPDDLNSFINYVNGPIVHMVLPLGGRFYAGKTPDQLEDWALKKAFNKKNDLYDVFKKFNIHECLLPEYIKRFGEDPEGPPKVAPAAPQETPSRSYLAEKPASSAPQSATAGRWRRS